MYKHLFLLSAGCLILSACEMDKSSMTTTDKTAPREHAQSDADRDLTQKIHQSILDDNSLSTNAKNVKIITMNGVVTLRGPVDSEKEKSEVGKKAKEIPGVKNVDNQLEIVKTEKTPAPVKNDVKK